MKFSFVSIYLNLFLILNSLIIQVKSKNVKIYQNMLMLKINDRNKIVNRKGRKKNPKKLYLQ